MSPTTGSSNTSFDAYLGAVDDRADSLPTLSGVPLATPWDARLAEVMLERGSSVEEEVVIDELVADLAVWT